MCQRVTCARCGRPTFAGCGRHVEQVLGDVPAEKRCQCQADARSGATTGKGTASGPSWLERLFTR